MTHLLEKCKVDVATEATAESFLSDSLREIFMKYVDVRKDLYHAKELGT